jgi:hypothetical protein
LCYTTNTFADIELAHNNRTKQLIVKACENYQRGFEQTLDNPCKTYIDGFIDAFLISQNARIGELEKTNNHDRSDLVKRAIKYRVGIKLKSESNDHYEFCLPENLDRTELKANIIRNLDLDSLTNTPLMLELLTTLKQLYPCGSS